MRLFLILIFIPQLVFANVLVLGDKTQILNYSAETKLKPEYEFYVDHYFNKKQQEIKKQTLIDRFEYAQLQFYSEYYDEAKKLFESLITETRGFILPEEVANLTSMAHIYRAAIETEHYKQIYWLKKAYNYNPEYKLSGDIKKTIKDKWQYIKKNEKHVKLTNLQKLKGYDVLVINNKKIALNEVDEISWPSGPVHIRLLSNHYLPTSINVNWPNIEDRQIKLEPIVNGDCLKPMVNSVAKLEAHVSAYFSPHCIVNLRNVQKFQPIKNITTAQEKSLEPSKITKTFKSTASPKSFWKNDWFWIGVIGLAILKSQESQKTNSQDGVLMPTGFN